MKREKGFTLIELLAVIVILAIIAVIASPIIIGVIEESREKSYVIEADNVAKQISFDIFNKKIKVNGVYTKAQVKSMFNMNIKGEKIIVTMINDEPYVSMIKDGKSYLSHSTKIYGLSWDGNDNYKRLKDAEGLVANAGVGSNVVRNDFDNEQIYGEIRDVIEDGNAFVKIPKFYIKKVVDQTGSNNKWEWYISKIKVDEGYYLPACFMDETNNKELDYILVGKYNASLEGTKLVSKSGLAPSHVSMIDFRTYALNNNVNGVKGYQLFDIHAMDVLQVLFYIEFGTLNSQSVMKGYSTGKSLWDTNHKVVSKGSNTITITSGGGSIYRVGQMIIIATATGGNDKIVDNLKITSISGDTLTYQTTQFTTGNVANIEVNHVVYNMANITGQTDGVKASSGTGAIVNNIDVNNTNGKYSMKYRGIENFYGGMQQAIDGINIDNATSKIYVNRNSITYSSNTIAGDYVELNYSKLNSNGYVTKVGYDNSNPYVNLPIFVNGNASINYADGYYQEATGINKKIVAFGGDWRLGSEVGCNYFALDVGSDGSNIQRGSRIMKTPIE